MATTDADLFRFFAQRGIQLGTPESGRRWVVTAFPGGPGPDDVKLLEGRAYHAFRRGAEYRGTLAEPTLAALDALLRDVPAAATPATLGTRIAEAAGSPDLAALVASDRFATWRAHAARALLVATFDPTAPFDDPDRPVLTRQLQVLGLLERLARQELTDAAQVRDFLTYAIVVLPRSALTGGATMREPRAARGDVGRSRARARADGRAAPGAADIRAAIDDVQRAVGLVARRRSEAAAADSPDPFAVSRIPKTYLRDRTRAVIGDLVPRSSAMSLPDVANLLEQQLIAHGLPAPAADPGVSPPSEPAGTAATAANPMAGLARLPGIADLKVVRTRLLGYRDGEIAQIENVMGKETRSREHRLLRRDTELATDLSETEKVNERDTQVAERFELAQESADTVSSDSKAEAGITVSASYGSFVSVTANAGFSSSTSQTHANRSSSKYARDVVDRSAAKVRTLVQSFRSRMSLTETEETNRHGFRNTTSEHVVGVYRWVEKVMEAQVFDYGKRLLLEVMVPDPARYYRQRRAGASLPGVTRTPPPPLEVADPLAPTGVRPLQPSDVVPATYLVHAGRYGATDVEPPPPLYRWVVDAWKEEKSQDPWASMSARKEIEVDPGYVPVFFRASVVYPERGIRLKPSDDAGGADSTGVISSEFPTSGVISVGGSRTTLGAGGGVVTGSPLSALQSSPTDKVGVAVMVERQTSYACEISVLCSRSADEYARWQIDAYASILRAFESRRSEYEAQVTAARERQDLEVASRPAAENEAVIRTELKRAALTLIQQRQPPFLPDAIGTEHPPVIDLSASTSGGPIQFFEQACEWNQLVYVPYGYYWADPARWDELADQDDGDAQMREFLRAGWARVVVPVRPAFTSAMCLYLSTGVIWNGDQAPQVDDPLYVSAVQEIQEADGVADGVPQGDPWQVVLPTALTHLQAGPDLPAP